MPRGTCPYCNLMQELEYTGMEENDSASFFTIMEETVITDSFNEVVKESICKGCGKKFQFMIDLRDSISKRKDN